MNLWNSLPSSQPLALSPDTFISNRLLTKSSTKWEAYNNWNIVVCIVFQQHLLQQLATTWCNYNNIDDDNDNDGNDDNDDYIDDYDDGDNDEDYDDDDEDDNNDDDDGRRLKWC